ncbi:MAG: mitochondrial fission ELM1 family protein [Bosea sp. (in: a-proteobacteria)]
MLPTSWIITDGKAGDLAQCIGVAEVMGLEPSQRVVKPRPPFTWAMPRGPIDPREGPGKTGSPIAPPYPDVLIASGRRAVPYVRAVKRLSGGHTFTIFLKDPRTGEKAADFIWVPAHDRLRGPNVMTTLVSPHKVSAAALEAARQHPPAAIASLKGTRVAVLVGGDSRHHRFKPEDITRFVQHLNQLASNGVSLMGSRSRRTPEALATMIGETFTRAGGWWWDGQGPNPYIALLANADAIVVTADSVNMIGEAAATGKPVLVFEPSGGHGKIGKFLNGLADHGVVHRFDGNVAGQPYEPLDSTRAIADAALAAYRTFRQTTS